uniref:Uncharacterized protein n=1 Tax=Arundo donax TaxID=35708 RepID=A0A0A9E253_ARUDO
MHTSSHHCLVQKLAILLHNKQNNLQHIQTKEERKILSDHATKVPEMQLCHWTSNLCNLQFQRYLLQLEVLSQK